MWRSVVLIARRWEVVDRVDYYSFCKGLYILLYLGGNDSCVGEAGDVLAGVLDRSILGLRLCGRGLVVLAFLCAELLQLRWVEFGAWVHLQCLYRDASLVLDEANPLS